MIPLKKKEILKLAERFAMPASLIGLGALLLLNPDGAAVVIARLLGLALTVAGLVTGLMSLSSREKRVSRLVWTAAELFLGTLLLQNPLLLARNLGRFLGVLLAIEGGECLRRRSPVFGGALLLAAVVLLFAPMTASRLVFTGCGLALLALGGAMLVSRLRQKQLEDGDDPNIIDAL